MTPVMEDVESLQSALNQTGPFLFLRKQIKRSGLLRETVCKESVVGVTIFREKIKNEGHHKGERHDVRTRKKRK